MRTASRFDSWLNAGASNPIVITDENNQRWVVKYRNNPQGLRVLVNEWVSSQLAKELELPVPESDFVDLPAELILAEDLRQKVTQELISSGISFGCRFIDKSNNHPTSYQIQNLVNNSVLPGVVVFDTWVINADRTTNQTNVLVAPVPNHAGQYQFHLIDLGMIIRPHWDISCLQWGRTHQKIYSVNPLLGTHVTHNPIAYLYYLDKLENLPITKIWSAVHSIPEEWQVSDDDMDELISFLEFRKMAVRPIIEREHLC